MKKILIILMLLVFVSGCELKDKLPFPASSSEETGEQKLLGSSGYVKMDILYPLEKEVLIYSHEFNEFTPAIRITNTGSANSRGQVCISGLESSIFGGASGCECLTYSFVKVPDEKFEPETLVFGPYSLSVPKEHSGDFALTAINRYLYRSEALFKPRIRKDPYDREDRNVDITASSNGPVTISSITETITPTTGGNVRLAFKVELKETVDGKLIPQQYLDMECAVGEIGSTEMQQIKPKVRGAITSLPRMRDIYCKEATLEKEKGTMECIVGEVQMFDENGNYLFGEEIQTPSKLTLEYAFETIDSNKFSVGSS